MPDISLPEVRFPKLELPEALRDMTRDDIQNALPDFGKQANKVANEAGKQAGKFADQAGKQAEKFVGKAGKEAGKFADKAGKEAGKFADDVASNIEQALPRRSGPSPVPFAVLAMAGGLVVGWILATSPTTAPKINSFMDWVRARIDGWRNDWSNRGLAGLDDDLDSGTSDLRSFSTELGSDAYAGAGSTSAMNVDPGTDTGLEGESWSRNTSPDTFKGQSLGAAAADDLNPDPVMADAVLVEEVIVVDSDGSATTEAGSGRMTDQMKFDDTEGDDLREPTFRDEVAPAGSGRLTETMKIDDTDESTDEAPLESPSTDRF